MRVLAKGSACAEPGVAGPVGSLRLGSSADPFQVHPILNSSNSKSKLVDGAESFCLSGTSSLQTLRRRTLAGLGV